MTTRIGIVHCSKDPTVTSAALAEIANALEEQSMTDFAAMWQVVGVRCEFYPNASAAVNFDGSVVTQGLPAGVWPHLVLDTPEEAGELGDHFVTVEGMPILRSFWGPIKTAGGTLFGDDSKDFGGESLSSTMSHETLETDLDPYVDAWVDMPDGKHEDAFEMCDRVEASCYKLQGSRVWLSNFLGPRAFREGPGPYDKLGVLSNPFDVAPGGYAIRRLGGPSGKTHAVWGENVPSWKKETKLRPHGKAARRGVRPDHITHSMSESLA